MKGPRSHATESRQFTVKSGRFDLYTGMSAETESRGRLRVVPD
ncbi:hypothetical protein ACWCOW_39935 [Streptomyces sp. NPDC001939]